MRNIIGSAMVITMALSLFLAVMLFGGASVEMAAPAFLLVAVLSVLWAIKVFTARTVSWKQSPTHWPVLAFVVYASIRYFTTSSPEYTARIELIQIGCYALLYFVAVNNFYHSRDRAVILGLFGALVVLQATYGIWQSASGSDTVYHLNRPPYYHGRGSGTYICPNHLAGFLEMALGLLAGRAVFFHGKRGVSDKDAIRKVMILYACVMAVAGIFTTFSRAGWIATLAAMSALVLWGESRWRALWQRIALYSLLGVVIFGLAYAAPKYLEPLNRSFTADNTMGGRIFMWNATASIIKAAPVLGTGPGSWQWQHQLHRHPTLQSHPIYAHSDSLHLTADYGLVGLLLVVAFLGCFFWHVALLTTRKTASEQRSMAIGAAVAVIAILAHSWGDFNLHIPANAMVLVLLVSCTVAMDDPHDKFPRAAMTRGPKIALCTLLTLFSVGLAWTTSKAALSTWAISKGNDAREILDWDGAIGHFETARRHDPGNPEALNQLGDVHRVQSFWRVGEDRRAERDDLARKATAYFKESLQLNPFQTFTYVRLANTHQTLGEFDKAIEVLNEGLRWDPLSALLHREMGLVYRKLGDEQKAADYMKRTEELNIVGDEVTRFHLEEIQPKN